MNTTPTRIQRKRTKGYKLPPNTICVTRPGKYGNPFIIGEWYRKGGLNTHYAHVINDRMADAESLLSLGYTQIKTNEEAVEWFRWHVDVTGEKFTSLRGWNLACWCKEGACCHGDVILEIANRGGCGMKTTSTHQFFVDEPVLSTSDDFSHDLNEGFLIVPGMTVNRWAAINRGAESLTPEDIANGWHFCPDWDYMLISKAMPETDACTCVLCAGGAA